MLLRARAPMVALTLLASLACGGIWNKVQAQAWVDLTVQLGAVPDGPNRVRVAEILDEGYLRTAENDIGYDELGDFRPVFRKALEDGAITDAELAGLEAAASAWSTPPAGMSADRQASRAKLLAAKRRSEERERKSAQRERITSFETWDMPEDLRARLIGIGIDVKSCDSDLYDGLRTTRCTGTVAASPPDTTRDYVEVEVEEQESVSDAREGIEGVDFAAAARDGRTVLVLSYVSQQKSRELSDAILARGPLHTLALEDVKKAGASLGYAKRTMECGIETEDGETDLDCTFDDGGAYAYVWMQREDGAKPLQDEEVFREFDRDVWEVDAGGIDLDVTVHVKQPAEDLLEALFRTP
ncbi:MAG: hypothetical protein R3F61_11235 [Myxococcota bacterium]